jgi:hypothetical protein
LTPYSLGWAIGVACLPTDPPMAAPLAGLEAYVALLQRCWAQAPEERPDFQHVARELRWAPRTAWQDPMATMGPHSRSLLFHRACLPSLPHNLLQGHAGSARRSGRAVRAQRGEHTTLCGLWLPILRHRHGLLVACLLCMNSFTHCLYCNKMRTVRQDGATQRGAF